MKSPPERASTWPEGARRTVVAGDSVRLGVAPLTCLSATVPEFIRAAAAAGYDEVGLRVARLNPTDPAFPRSAGSEQFGEIRAALDAAHMTVGEIEVFALHPDSDRDTWNEQLRIGQLLGARSALVVADDRYLHRFRARFAAFAADALDRGIRPLLEPTVGRVLTFAAAFDLAEKLGAGIVLDPFHFVRTGADPAVFRGREHLIECLQLCDVSPDRPADIIAESRTARLIPGDGVAPLASLLAAAPPTASLTVEVPDAGLRGDLSLAGFLELLRTRTTDFLLTMNRSDDE